MRASSRWMAGLFLASASCATVFQGEYSAVPITSDPVCAAVYVNGIPSGYTPTTLKLQSKNNYTVELRMPGFQSAAAATNSRVQGGWLVLDILFALIPAIVDAATGAWYAQEPGALHFVLKGGASPPSHYPPQAGTMEECLNVLAAAEQLARAETEQLARAKSEAQPQPSAKCLETAETLQTPQLVAWGKADCMSPRPPIPATTKSTKRLGEKCTWSAECLPGLACPWGHCIMWKATSAAR